MTGYGHGTSKAMGAEITIAVKSVNGRFLDSRFHLPKEYYGLEVHLKKLLSQHFRRGTVDVYINRRAVARQKIEINLDAAKKWVAANKALAKALQLPLSSESLMERLLQRSEIFSIHENHELSAAEKESLFKAARMAFASCETERSREGAALRQHLIRLMQQLTETVKKMVRMREKAKIDFENRLKEKIKKMGIGSLPVSDRLMQELVVLVEKSDISEELERLQEHVTMCAQALKANGEQGKKLDFYTQELLREINTVGSKANYAPLTELVVDAKSLVEAFKEQVQNVE